MELLIIVGIVSAVVALIVKAVKEHNRKIEDAWSDAARQLGMQFTSGSFMQTKSIHGRTHDNRVEVDTFKRSTGQSSTTYTRYRIHYPETLGLGLRLKQQSFVAEMAAFFGSQDIEVGEPQFDATVVVKSTRPERIAEFLTPSRRSRILRLFQEYPACEITDHVIEWSKKGNEKQAEQIVSTVRRLARAATHLHASGESSGDEETGERVSEPREVGKPILPEPEPVLSVPVSEFEPPVPVPEPEPVVSEPEPPAPVPDPIVQAPESEQPTAEPAPAAATAGPDVTTVCEDLFAKGMTRTEAKRLFDERYKGQPVCWSGKLRNLSAYHIDVVFKGDPGTKIVLDIHGDIGGVLGRPAQAIVQLPQDALDGLRTRMGERITFEGRFLSYDALMGSFYVVEGRLV